MTAILVLLLLVFTVFLLAASLLYLYRWLVRRRLFPQLPRLWQGQKRGFLISSAAFVVCLAAFLVLGIGGPAPAPKRAAQAPNRPMGPSFDGQPPPKLVPKPGPPSERPGAVLAKAQAPAGPAVKPPAPQEVPRARQGQVMAPGELERQAKVAGTPAARPAPAGQTAAPPQGANPPASAPVTEPKPAPAPQPPPAPAPAPKAEPATRPAAQAAPAAAPAAKPAPASEPKAAPAPAPKAAPQPKPAPAPKAKPEPKPAPAPKAKAAKPAPGKAYTVCLSSFKDMASAKAKAKELAGKGIKARVAAADLGAKGRWYRVLAGRFETPGQAKRQADVWRKQGLAGSPFPIRER